MADILAEIAEYKRGLVAERKRSRSLADVRAHARDLPEPASPSATTAELKPERIHSNAGAPAESKSDSGDSGDDDTRKRRTDDASGVSAGQRGSLA